MQADSVYLQHFAVQVDPQNKLADIGDFDQDRKADLVWRHTASGDNTIWLMNGSTLKESVPSVRVPDLDFKIINLSLGVRDHH